ncbi:methionine--tRNA ligase [Candidatus Gracilibacteria bacterium]|nr:methionine--tRNA ligase [Candidatus Gracilibacteria bacterium]
MQKKLITTAIPYMNGVPHIGHALEVILSDVIARGYRLLGEEVFFLTGADEHGSKILKTAETAGRDVMEMLDENVGHFQDMNRALSISNDGYIRTSDKEKHWPVVQALWMKLVDRGDIYKKAYSGYYCDREERFVTEEELDENKCLKENGAPTRWTEDENYFFKLSRYSDTIKEKLINGDVKITPEFRQNEMIAMIGDGLEDVSFSRTKKQLTWGIPVPNDSDHVMYVWCDALTNYISGISTGNIEEDFKNWNCELHVIGKDIARFHCLTWIGMLLSAGINLPKNILVHGFVNDKDGAKMSKSVGNVIDPHAMIAEYGPDTVRLYMTSEVGVGQDLNFSDERIKSIHNDVLANNYGNLVNRVISLWIAFREKELGDLKFGDEIITKGENETLSTIKESYKNAVRKYDTQKAFSQIDYMLNEANGMLNRLEPWKKSGKEKGDILVMGLVYVYNITLLLSPFIPEATSKVMKAMETKEGTTLDDPISINLNTITKPDILFEKK